MTYTLKTTLALLILCAACTPPKDSPPAVEPAPLRAVQVPALPIKGAVSDKKNQDHELQKVAKWFEQMDAILRESLWVVKKERPPQSKSIFGKMQRAALVEMKEKLANKSLFRCDIYSMSRNIGGISGVPQSAEVLHKCGSKEDFAKIGDWNHPTANVLTMNFRGGNLEDMLGLATSILSPKISCELRSNDNGTIESFSCKGLMIDYDAKKSQVLRFSRFEYERGSQKILHLRAEVLENLDPIRKIEADVPVEGAIQVIETVLQAPQVEAKQVPAPTPPPAPQLAKKPKPPENNNGDRPQEDPQSPILETPAVRGAPQVKDQVEGQAESGEIQEAQPTAPPQQGEPIPQIPTGGGTR
jgi:hypothetical protein